MIEIKGLYKSFDDKTVLSDINADFANGKTNLIICLLYTSPSPRD